MYGNTRTEINNIQKEKNFSLHLVAFTSAATLKVTSIEQKTVITHLVKKLPNFWNLSVHFVFSTAHH
jgi:hypothetical protein